MIEVESLSKSYGTVSVLRGVSFRALPGEIAILTGDNGAGKSTLLRTLAGLSRPSAGTAKIAGHDIATSRRETQVNLSFLPQGLTFHPSATPEWLVRFYASIRRIRIARKDTDSLLERLDLLEERRKPVRHLSGGMVQRLGLALLLLPDSPVLLLDEPAISLDPDWRHRLAEILHAEAARGKTVFLTTHLPTEWEGGAHQHLCCRDGGVFPAGGATPENRPGGSAPAGRPNEPARP